MKEQKVYKKRECFHYGLLNKKTDEIEGYYTKEVNGIEKIEQLKKEGCLPLSEELWKKLLKLGVVKVDTSGLLNIPMKMSEDGSEGFYCMEHIEYFKGIGCVETEASRTQVSPLEVLEEKVLGLETKMDEILKLLGK